MSRGTWKIAIVGVLIALAVASAARAAGCDAELVRNLYSNRCNIAPSPLTSPVPAIVPEEAPAELAAVKPENLLKWPSAKTQAWQEVTSVTGVRSGRANIAVLRRETARLESGDPQIVEMIIRCRNNQTNLILTFPGQEMSDKGPLSEGYFTLDSGQPQIVEFGLSKVPETIGIWQGFRAVPVLRQMLDAKKMDVTIWNAAGQEINVNFDLGGLPDAVMGVRESCQW